MDRCRTPILDSDMEGQVDSCRTPILDSDMEGQVDRCRTPILDSDKEGQVDRCRTPSLDPDPYYNKSIVAIEIFGMEGRTILLTYHEESSMILTPLNA